VIGQRVKAVIIEFEDHAMRIDAVHIAAIESVHTNMMFDERTTYTLTITGEFDIQKLYGSGSPVKEDKPQRAISRFSLLEKENNGE